jgi:hypothetical protein
MAMTYVPVVGFFAPDGLALPATQLIKNGRASAPIGVFPAMREQLRDLLPTLSDLGPLKVEGLGNGLAGNAELQGEAPGVHTRVRCPGFRLSRSSHLRRHMGHCSAMTVDRAGSSMVWYRSYV